MNEARRKNQKRKRKSDDEGGPDNEGMERGRKREKKIRKWIKKNILHACLMTNVCEDNGKNGERCHLLSPFAFFYFPQRLSI